MQMLGVDCTILISIVATTFQQEPITPHRSLFGLHPLALANQLSAP
jgi:hypothetical protein